MVKKSEDEVQLEVTKSNIGPEGAGIILKAEIANVPPNITVPRLIRAGAATESVEEIANGERKDETSKTRRAAILMLDILEEEGEQKQSELFERVANETALKVGTIKRKVYWDILQEEQLVDNRKDGFQGGWLVCRSERERPPSLQSVTLKLDRSMTPSGHTSTGGHPSGGLPSIANHDLDTTKGHPSYNKVTSVTSVMVCQEEGHPSPKVPETMETKYSAPAEPEDIGRI